MCNPRPQDPKYSNQHEVASFPTDMNNPSSKDPRNFDSLDGRTGIAVTSEPEWAMGDRRPIDTKYSRGSEGTTFYTVGSKIPTELKILEDDLSQKEWPAQCNTIVHYPDSSCLSSHAVSRSASPLPIAYTTNTLTQTVPSRMAGRKYSSILYSNLYKICQLHGLITS